MRNKLVAAIAVIGLVICFSVIIMSTMNGKFDGTTVKSREAILRSEGQQTEWTILSETEVNGYLVCSIRSTEQIGIALFEPLENGTHSFITWVKREPNEIVSLPVRLNEVEYLLLFADIPNPDHAEVIFTVDSLPTAPVMLDATSGTVLSVELPSDDYTAEITYYDIDGNKYE